MNTYFPGGRRATHAPVAMLAACSLLAGGCALFEPAAPETNVERLPQLRPGVAAGYLPRAELVNSLELVGPPPPAGSPAKAADDEARRVAAAARDTPRWRLAARDADYRSVHAVDAFACTMGVRISPQTTPQLNMLMRRSLVDAGLATYTAKKRYERTRPFVEAGEGTCAPDDEEGLRKDGSYPSGHASFGWAWGLILAEMDPARANAILQRGYDYGQSRVYCGYHWQSDVNAGRVVGAAVVAQLHANADFQAQFRAAQRELAAVRAAGTAVPDCALERAAARPAR